MKKIFISYRRQDSGTAARRIAADFGTRYGEGSVFIDTDAIRIGNDWAHDIDQALERAQIILAVIGPKWIHTHDEHGRRRIDNNSDWVRIEVLHGLSQSKRVLPLLVQGAERLDPVALPEALQSLCKIQSYQIADEFWKRDIEFLWADLEKSGALPQHAAADIVYPAERDKSVALTDDEVLAYIDPSSGWALNASELTIRGATAVITELKKTYQFQSFDDCIHFMNSAARHITFIDHHPRWENIWINLSVNLSTWDIKPPALTYKDVRLAKYLDELFIAYKKQSEA